MRAIILQLFLYFTIQALVACGLTGALPSSEENQSSSQALPPQSTLSDPEAAWKRLGISGVNGKIYDMHVFENRLIVGGVFDRADNLPAAGIAAWDGSIWLPFSRGIAQGVVTGFANFSGNLIAAGHFVDVSGDTFLIGTYDGAGWRPFEPKLVADPSTQSGWVSSVASHGTALIATGHFMLPSGDVVDIAKWSAGSWQPILSPALGPSRKIHSIGDQLYANLFPLEDNPTALAIFNGSTWNRTGLLRFDPLYERIESNDLVEFKGRLIVAGAFGSVDQIVTRGVAEWDGSTWSPMGRGVQGIVHALVVVGADLVAGGKFSGAGQREAHHVARWDGSAWFPLGQGTNAPVNTATDFRGDLIAAGNFTKAGDVDVNFIASYGPPQ